MPRVSSSKFFAEQTAQSRVKARIVYKYVLGWAPIVLSPKFNTRGEAAYIDLFSGPGTYDDGARSTPLMIAEDVLKRPQLRKGVRMFFNDAKPSYTKSLRQEIETLAEIDKLQHPPNFTSEPATISLIRSFELPQNVPQFYFLDQFGWADIMPPLIQYIFSARKCDCAFFLRTARLVAAVTNPNSEQTMIALFGVSGLEALRHGFKQRPRHKESVILEQLKSVMRSAGAPYFLPFPFRVSGANSSRQHLIYLGKHSKGFELMKEVMASSSSVNYGGVPVIGFTDGPFQHSLFAPDLISELQRQLVSTFSGRSLTVGDVLSEHHVTSECYILRNYQEAIRRLEASSQIVADPPAALRPKRYGIVTVSEDVRVTFPDGGRGDESVLFN